MTQKPSKGQGNYRILLRVENQGYNRFSFTDDRFLVIWLINPSSYVVWFLTLFKSVETSKLNLENRGLTMVQIVWLGFSYL